MDCKNSWDEEFTNSKSELKYFEAAIVRTQTIATQTPTYGEAIKDGYNGYLAPPGELYNNISIVLKNSIDMSLLRSECEHAIQNYSPRYLIRLLEVIFESIMS